MSAIDSYGDFDLPEEKLKEIEFLKDTTDVNKIDKFDFNKFKDKTIEINKEIIKNIYN